MSTVQGLRAGIIAGILIGMTLTAGTVSAQGNFTTERPSSILIYPKVVNTSDPDTIIQITNTSNSVTYAHCFYTDGRVVNGAPVWQVTDFDLVLTRQQPTHWSVAEGRPVDPRDGIGGLDPGLIPPVPVGFTGFLLCVETAVDGTPVSANSLKGEATIGSVTAVPGASNVSKYNAIGIPACVSAQGPCGASGVGNDGNNVLRLDGQEYAECPGGMYLNFTGEDAPDPALDGAGNTPSSVSTNLALVPCGMDFENLIPTSTTLTVNIRNEFENFTSIEQLRTTCWFDDTLGGTSFGGVFSPLLFNSLGTTFGTAIIRPFTGSGLPPAVGVANVLRTAGDGSSDTAAMNLPFCTDESAPSSCVPFSSTIRLPSIK